MMLVTRTLVDTVGLKAALLALASVAYAKAIECAKDEPALADTWQTVADDIESFARTSLRGLR